MSNYNYSHSYRNNQRGNGNFSSGANARYNSPSSSGHGHSSSQGQNYNSGYNRMGPIPQIMATGRVNYRPQSINQYQYQYPNNRGGQGGYRPSFYRPRPYIRHRRWMTSASGDYDTGFGGGGNDYATSTNTSSAAGAASGCGDGPQNNSSNELIGGGGDAPAPLFDPSEFPSLSSVRNHSYKKKASKNNAQPVSGVSYKNLFKESTEPQFTFTKADFPALPGGKKPEVAESIPVVLQSTVDIASVGVGGGGTEIDIGTGIEFGLGDGTCEPVIGPLVVSVPGVVDEQTDGAMHVGVGGGAAGETGGQAMGSVSEGMGVGLAGAVVGVAGGGEGGGGSLGLGAEFNLGAFVNTASGGSGANGEQMQRQEHDFFNNRANFHSYNPNINIQITPDGMVRNIPPSLIPNQYGMVGLLSFLRAAAGNPNIVPISMSTDLDNLDEPQRPEEENFGLPPEYLVNQTIGSRLAFPNLGKAPEDNLFFMFYFCVGDLKQILAASELYKRNWRYYIEERIWIARIPGFNRYIRNGFMEKGTYFYFDARTWRRLTKALVIDGNKLETCPDIQRYINRMNVVH